MAAAPRARRATTVSWPSSRPPTRLLEERSIAEISVDDLAKGAGISRPTFYFYFPSKDAVLFTLFERVIREADAAFEQHTESPTGSTDRYEMWRAGIRRFLRDVRSPSRP